MKDFLKPEGYYEVEHTPGLWSHKWKPIQFTPLVVEDFGIKYIGKEHAEYLISMLKRKYTAVASD